MIWKHMETRNISLIISSVRVYVDGKQYNDQATPGQNEDASGGGHSKPTVFCAKKKVRAYTKLLRNAGLSQKAVFKQLN